MVLRTDPGTSIAMISTLDCLDMFTRTGITVEKIYKTRLVNFTADDKEWCEVCKVRAHSHPASVFGFPVHFGFCCPSLKSNIQAPYHVSVFAFSHCAAVLVLVFVICVKHKLRSDFFSIYYAVT